MCWTIQGHKVIKVHYKIVLVQKWEDGEKIQCAPQLTNLGRFDSIGLFCKTPRKHLGSGSPAQYQTSEVTVKPTVLYEVEETSSQGYWNALLVFANSLQEIAGKLLLVDSNCVS